jgi:hypothetical protein
MASAQLSRRVEKVVRCPPLCEMDDGQRREFHEELLDADSFEDLPGKLQAAIVAAEQSRSKLRVIGDANQAGADARDTACMKLQATIVISYRADSFADAGGALDDVLRRSRERDDVEIESIQLSTPSSAGPVSLPYVERPPDPPKRVPHPLPDGQHN